MEKVRLLKVEDTITLNNMKGFAYVVNSDGRKSNLTLYYVVELNTIDNTIKSIRYEIEMFKPSQADYVREIFSGYAGAVERYNWLATEFSGHRE